MSANRQLLRVDLPARRLVPAAQQQHVGEEVERRAVDIRIPSLRLADRAMDECDIPLGIHAALIRIRPVDREAGDGLADDGFEDVVGEVPSMPVRRGDLAEHVGQHVHLAGQRALHHLQLRPVDYLVRVRRMAEYAVIERVERLEAFALDEDVVGEVDEVVAGGAVHRPLPRHMLVRLQDLLHYDIQGAMRRAPVISAHRIKYCPLDAVGGSLGLRLRSCALARQIKQAAAGSGTDAD